MAIYSEQHPQFETIQDYTREIFTRLNTAANGKWDLTAVQETRAKRNPYRTLVSSMLSSRTTEEANREATNNLFAMAQTPEEMLQVSDEQIAQAIRMVTYPEPKVGYMRGMAQMLVDEFESQVPQALDDLMRLPGIGWKTGTLTQWIAFGIAEEICVDVHVARIGKRLGLVNESTKKPQKVSRELMELVPDDLWGRWNPMMVRFGREVCFYHTPNCPACPLNDICPKVGVARRA